MSNLTATIFVHIDHNKIRQSVHMFFFLCECTRSKKKNHNLNVELQKLNWGSFILQLGDKWDVLGSYMLRINLMCNFVPVKEAVSCMFVCTWSERGLEHIWDGIHVYVPGVPWNFNTVHAGIAGDWAGWTKAASGTVRAHDPSQPAVSVAPAHVSVMASTRLLPPMAPRSGLQGWSSSEAAGGREGLKIQAWYCCQRVNNAGKGVQKGSFLQKNVSFYTQLFFTLG